MQIGSLLRDSTCTASLCLPLEGNATLDEDEELESESEEISQEVAEA